MFLRWTFLRMWPLSDSETLFTNAVLDVVWGCWHCQISKRWAGQRGTSGWAELLKMDDTVTVTCLFSITEVNRTVPKTGNAKLLNFVHVSSFVCLYLDLCYTLSLAMWVEQMSFHHSSKALKGQKRSSSVAAAWVSLTKGTLLTLTNNIACRRMLHLPISKNPQTDVDMNTLFQWWQELIVCSCKSLSQKEEG